MDPNIVILAGGISSRMKNSPAKDVEIGSGLLLEAEKKPKAMIGVGMHGRPLLDFLLYNIKTSGYEEAVIVIGENDMHFREYYGDASDQERSFGLKISYAIQKIPVGRSKPLGTADALHCALLARRDWKGKQFTVCNSDNIYSQQALGLLRESHHPCALIDYDRDALGFEQSRIEQFAIVTKNAEGFLTDIIEKPGPEELRTAADASGRVGISMNIFRFSYDVVMPYLEKTPLHPVRMEKEIPAAVKMLIRDHPNSVGTIPLAEYVPDLTMKGDIPKVQEYLKREFPFLSVREHA